MLRLNLSLLISWRYFLMKKSKDTNWPYVGVHEDFRIWSVSKVSLFKVLELSSLSWKKYFHLEAAREFFNVLLDWKFVDFSEMGTKYKLLLRTDFSESERGKFSGMRIAVLRFSGDESLLFWGPISWSSFLCFNFVQTVKYFSTGILNFGTNRFY